MPSMVEYANNLLISTGMCPFMVNSGYQLPLFPSQESEVTVRSIHVQFRRVRRVWRETRAAQSTTAERNRPLAYWRRIRALDYQVGQRLWLSARDLPYSSVVSQNGSLLHCPPSPLTRLSTPVPSASTLSFLKLPPPLFDGHPFAGMAEGSSTSLSGRGTSRRTAP